MGLLKKLFGGRKKATAIESIASQFDVAKDEFLKIITEGLSDPDQQERKICANIIREKVIPALALDMNPASKAASLATVKVLISELRAPQNDAEINDLNNAAFHYMRKQLQEQSHQ